MVNEELLGEFPPKISTFSVLLVIVGGFFIVTESTRAITAFFLIGSGLIVALIDWIFNLRLKNARTNMIKNEISKKDEEPEGAAALPQDQPMDERSQINYEQLTETESEEEVEDGS